MCSEWRDGWPERGGMLLGGLLEELRPEGPLGLSCGRWWGNATKLILVSFRTFSRTINLKINILKHFDG